MIIYKITNTINIKVYIGQTSSSNNTRWLSHRNKLRKGAHPNKHLQSSWNKYGEKCFIYEIIASGCIGTLDCLEIYYIKKYNSTNNKFGYNKDYGGHLNRMRKSSSEETKRKLSIAHTGKKHPHSEETKKNISNANKGKPNKLKGIPTGKKGMSMKNIVSKETRQKMSEAKIGKKRKPITKENRQNISEAAKIGWIKT